MNHKLKITEERLENLLSGIKKVEIRINDRDYQRGDTLEFVENKFSSTVVKHVFAITHIHSGLGLQPNYVALSVEKLP